MGGRENHEKSFDNYHVGETPSYISLSPSNHTRLETGSVGNSPRKKPSALKHPLISKKSPLFKKFGLDAVFANQNNSNAGFSDGYEAYLQEKKQLKTSTPPLENEMLNIQNRINLSQKHYEIKKPIGSETPAIGSHFNTSLSNINEDKASESFTFYSAKKTNHTPRDQALSKAGLDVYNSEPHLNSEPTVALSHSINNQPKAKIINAKENFPGVKGALDLKPPQPLPSQNHGIISSKLRQPILTQKISLLKAGSITEENLPNENSIKEAGPNEFRRKIVQPVKKVVFNPKVIVGSVKDGLVNESINSLELSAIHDVNDKDVLNISKDDALLQYIDKGQSEQEALDKLPKNPLKLLKQLTSDFSATNNDDSHRSVKKSDSLSNPDSPGIHPEEPISAQISTAVLKEDNETKPLVYTQNRGRKMQTRGFNEENIPKIPNQLAHKAYGNHDRNSSMIEIQK